MPQENVRQERGPGKAFRESPTGSVDTKMETSAIITNIETKAAVWATMAAAAAMTAASAATVAFFKAGSYSGGRARGVAVAALKKEKGGLN